MPEVSLVVDAVRPTGSAAARRLRVAGKVPAVLYGHGVDPQAVAVDRRQLRTALAGEAGSNTLIALEVGADRHLAMARQIQRDPIRGTVSHVDFVIVGRDEIISAEVPVRLIGESVSVARAEGTLDQQLFTILVHARPADIPTAVEFDVSALVVGDSVRIGDLPLPVGVQAELDADETVAAIHGSRVEEEPAESEGAGAAEATP